MFRPRQQPVWKTAPFIRLLLPLIIGIVLQWNLQFSFLLIAFTLISFLLSFVLSGLLPLVIKFSWPSLQGLLLFLILICTGALLTWQKDIRHHQEWFGNHFREGDLLIVRLNEPPLEKTKSFKVEGSVESILHGDSVISCDGNLLLYFSKEPSVGSLHYGDRILVNKPPQSIKNTGNPGAFNYQQYAAFQQVFHQVFLKRSDWVMLDNKGINVFRKFIFTAQQYILHSLQKNLPTDKDELGLAEALLIGYTNDLDKDLVQAYTNTGVVHIIAISGMHLTLIYFLLVGLFARIPAIKRIKILQIIIVLVCLWLFSLLTGAAASVLRAAVMFSFISIGKYFSKGSTIINSLASSAFVLLCYNPYFLWDVGFQLSYLAVAGIIVFQRPVYQLLQLKNRLADEVWKLVSVSLAAQTLTFPICIYYFHQFPMLFLLANIIAVPLSSIILYAEIALVVLSGLPFIGPLAGKITYWLVWCMNKAILWINQLSFSLWDNIQASLVSTILLYSIIIAFSAWFIYKNSRILLYGLGISLLFVVHYTYDKWLVMYQQKLVVYNLYRHQAADLVIGDAYLFKGDSILKKRGQLNTTLLRPSRIAMGLSKPVDSFETVFHHDQFWQFGTTRILFLNEPLIYEPDREKINIDLIILSGNPGITIPQLAGVFNCGLYVFDASNSLWKIGKWQADCSSLHLQCFSIPENGAFVRDL